MTLLHSIGLLLIAARPNPVQGQAAASFQLTVVVRETADVPGSEFTLGEIAAITGTDKALALQVAAVRVGTSPLAGLTRFIEQGDILIKLRANRIDPKLIDLKCPSKVRISRAGAEIPAQEMIEAALAKLTDERKSLADGATLEAVPLTGRWYASPGKREYKAVVSRGSLETGPIVMTVTTLIDGNPVKSVDITVRLKRTVAALRAKRPIQPHAIIAADDVTVGTVELAPGAPIPIADVQAVIGKRSTRQLALGDLLTDTAVELSPVVTNGQQVTLEIVIGSIRLNAPAIARQAGALGQSIRVFTTDTHKEFTAVVLDGKTVRVEEN